MPITVRNPTVHYCAHNSRPPMPIFSQIILLHALQIDLLKIHFNSILPSTSRCSHWFFSSVFPTHALYGPLLSPTRATCPAHLILLDRPNIWWGVQIIKFNAVHFSLVPYDFLSLRPNYLHQQRVISGFRRAGDENCALPGHYTASSCISYRRYVAW